MNKIILAAIIACCAFINKAYSQSGNEQIWKSGVVGTSVISASSLSAESISYLYEKFSRFEAAVYCDSSLKVGLDNGFTDGKFIISKAGQWNYLGQFTAALQTDLWFRKASDESTNVSYQLIIWGYK